MNGTDFWIPARVAAFRLLVRRHPTAVSVVGSLVVAATLAVALAGKGGEFVAAVGSAPVWVLAAAVSLHIFWLVARSEAWSVCIGAAGGSVSRRRLYRAFSVGYLGNIVNGQFGLAVRIAALRRTAPADSPGPTYWSLPSCRSSSSRRRSRRSAPSPWSGRSASRGGFRSSASGRWWW